MRRKKRWGTPIASVQIREILVIPRPLDIATEPYSLAVCQ